MSKPLQLTAEDSKRIWDILRPLWKTEIPLGSGATTIGMLYFALSDQIDKNERLNLPMEDLQLGVNKVRYEAATELTEKRADAIMRPEQAIRSLAPFVRAHFDETKIKAALTYAHLAKFDDGSITPDSLAATCEQVANALPKASLITLERAITDLRHEQGISTSGRGAA